MRIIFQMTSTGDFSDSAREVFMADTSLYVGDVKGDAPPGCIFNEAAGEGPDLPYLNWAFVCVHDNLAEIDKLIEGASENWALDRMNTVDLAILRVAVAELLYMDDIDVGTSIDEAVLMAKKYGTGNSSVFINGILGALARARNERIEVAP